MKTADPNRYLDDFSSQVRDGLAQFKHVSKLLSEASAKADLQKAITEDSALRLGALWEIFQGRWHVAAISRAPTAFITSTEKLLESKIKDDVRGILLGLNPTSITVPKHPTIAQIEAILDPNRFNVTFKDTEAWVENSAKYHSSKYQQIVKNIATDAEAASLLDFLKKLRNHLAHGSHGSKAAFARACKTRRPGEKVGLTGVKNADLARDQRQVRDIGAYLRARAKPTGPCRLEVLYVRVIEVAELLRS